MGIPSGVVLMYLWCRRLTLNEKKSVLPEIKNEANKDMLELKLS